MGPIGPPGQPGLRGDKGTKGNSGDKGTAGEPGSPGKFYTPFKVMYQASNILKNLQLKPYNFLNSDT